MTWQRAYGSFVLLGLLLLPLVLVLVLLLLLLRVHAPQSPQTAQVP
jgi:hypothetical protein